MKYLPLLFLCVTNLCVASCPSVAAIKNVGLDFYFQTNGKWGGSRLESTYGTAQRWSFTFQAVAAKNKSDAAKKLQNALNSLVFDTEYYGGCYYSSSLGKRSGVASPGASSDDL